jgi:branched-chain amino acid transport system substrate-binding protein
MKRCAILACALAAATAFAQTPGVSRNEVVLGTIQDLSGPLASYGKQIRNGMLMALEETNDIGGVHGRKLRLLVEDSGYDPKRAVLAAQKLVGQDHGIFAMVGHLGTAHNMAAMPVQFERNVINFFPITAAREMYEPFHRLKYSNAATYYDQMKLAAPRLVKDGRHSRPCVIYQDDDFGLEVMRGAQDGLKSIGMQFTEKTSYKRGATDFSSQVARMKAANCDLVVLGTIIRETVGTIAESRKTGFSPVFLGSSAVYTDLIPRLGGKPMDGLYATMTAQHPYVDAAEQPVRFWASKYRTRFNEDPTVFSVYGYAAVDSWVKAAFKTGPALTTDAFIRTMDSMTITRNMFGTAEQTFTPTKRLGNRYARLSQIQDGRWKVTTDYVAFAGLKPVLQKDGKWKIESEFLRDQ